VQRTATGASTATGTGTGTCTGALRGDQVRGRTVTRMTYSQPDPAEETTQTDAPEQPDTDAATEEESGREDAALEVDSDDVPTSDA
jgi:hypothetical protein